MNKYKSFFYKFMPFIFWTNVIFVNVIGYAADTYLPEGYDWIIWSTVMLIAMGFSYQGGKAIQRLHRGTYTDCLTELGNRNFFYLTMAHDMEMVKKNKVPVSLLMIDVDNFKPVNDRYGHPMGDNVLKQIARVFEESVRSNDTVIRWGGEEFAVILPGTDAQGAYSLGERLRSAVEARDFYCEVATCRVTISVGVITVMEEVDINYFVQLADKALYKAKEKKNTVVKSTAI